MMFAGLGLVLPGAAHTQAGTGRFENPPTDVCWECLFPISIGRTGIGSVGAEHWESALAAVLLRHPVLFFEPVDQGTATALPEGPEGDTVAWQPLCVGAR